MTRRILAAVAAAAMTTIGTARAEQIMVTIENMQSTGGFFFTPVWLGFHDGGYDVFNAGEASSSELEALAEEGMTGPLSAAFGATTNSDATGRYDFTATAPAGFGGAPVFEPGEVMSYVLDVPDSASNRYLSYSSMIIPSNDGFFGNDDPMSVMVFAGDGTLAGDVELLISGASLWDAGTEANDTMGAAFSALGGTASDEGGVIAAHGGLANFVGSMTASGDQITADLGAADALARVTITQVPEPATWLLAVGLAGVALAARRRAAA